jgi:hypothetical protein
MKTFTITSKLKSRDVVKKAMYLAYEACGGTTGMGILQAVEGATEDDVWNNVLNKGDYPRDSNAKDSPTSGSVYADYVFGRMMKLNLHWDKDGVNYPDCKLNPEYQSWSRSYMYNTMEDLLVAAVDLCNPHNPKNKKNRN